MASRNRWLVFSLTGLFLAAVAGFAYAAASEEAAAGVNASAEASTGASPVHHSRIKLVLDHAGDAEHLTLDDLHDLAVGESRTFTTDSGTPVVVTRDDEGFEVDLNGKKIRLADHFAEGEPGTFQKRIVLRSADGADGSNGGEEDSSNVIFLRHKIAGGEGTAISTSSTSGESVSDVVVVRKVEGNGHAFAFATDGAELPAFALPVEATIHRLEASAKFQALDATTRATVLEALRESAPKAGALVAGEPGAKTMVIEIGDTDEIAEPDAN